MSLRRLAAGIWTIGVLAIAAATTAAAGEVTGVTVSPTAISIAEGSSGTYQVVVTSISGNIPASPNVAPALTYCSSWTIHSDGSNTCNSQAMIPLQTGRNYTQNPLTAAEILALTRTVTVNVDSGLCGQSFTLTDTITLPAGSGTDFGGGSLGIIRSVTVNVTCDNVLGGCSHGYWKNHQTAWQTYTPATALGSVFTMGPTYSSIASSTFEQALAFGGGPTVVDKAKLLMVQAVAALLNAAQPLIGYPLSEADIIAQVNAALASEDEQQILALQTTLDEYNNLGSAVCVDE